MKSAKEQTVESLEQRAMLSSITFAEQPIVATDYTFTSATGWVIRTQIVILNSVSRVLNPVASPRNNNNKITTRSKQSQPVPIGPNQSKRETQVARQSEALIQLLQDEHASQKYEKISLPTNTNFSSPLSTMLTPTAHQIADDSSESKSVNFKSESRNNHDLRSQSVESATEFTRRKRTETSAQAAMLWVPGSSLVGTMWSKFSKKLSHHAVDASSVSRSEPVQLANLRRVEPGHFDVASAISSTVFTSPVRYFWRRLRPFVLLLLPTPALIAMFLQNNHPVGRIILGAVCILAAIIASLWMYHEFLISRRRNIVASILLTSSLVVSLGLVWNEGYRDYSRLVPRREVFRVNMYKYHTPVYGVPKTAELQPAISAVVITSLAAILVLRSSMNRRMTWRGLSVIIALQIAAILSFAISEGDERIIGNSPHFLPFYSDAVKFSGYGELLAGYVQEMPKLSWFGQHYPPGSALLFMADMRMGIPLLAMGILICSVGLSTIFVHKTASLLSDRPLVANLAAMIYACATGPLIYPTISTSALITLPASIAVWSAIRSCKSGSIISAVVLGATMFIFAMFSFSAIFLGILLAIFLGSAGLLSQLRKMRVIKCTIISITMSFLLVFVTRMTTGFDLLECASIGVKFHHIQAASNGYDNVNSYFMRSTGNLLAFVLVNLPLIGILVGGLISWRKPDFTNLSRLLIPCVVLSMLLAAFSGNFYFETERIWLFFVPVLCIAAAVELGRFDDFRGRWDARVVVAMMILFAITQELAFMHYS